MIALSYVLFCRVLALLEVRAMTDVQDILKMHLQGTERLNELLAKCEKLNADGKKREAAKVLKQAEKIRTNLAALEASLKRVNPHDSST